TADQNDNQSLAQQMYETLRRRGLPYDRFEQALNFANMRQSPGVQAADVLAYEIVKELSNQDLRPESRMRWPLDQILVDQATREIMMVVYRSRTYLQGQMDGIMDTDAGTAIVDRDIDEMMRIYRERKSQMRRHE